MATDPKEIGCGCLIWIMIIGGAWWWFSQDNGLNDLSPTKISSIQEGNNLLNGYWALDYKETFSSNKMMKEEMNKNSNFFNDNYFNNLPQIIFNFDANQHKLELITMFNKKEKHIMKKCPYNIVKAKSNYVEIKSPIDIFSVKIEFFDDGKTIKVIGDKPFLSNQSEFATKYAIMHKINSN